MDSNVTLFMQSLFWTLSAIIVFLPMRWAVLGLILITHVDMTTATFESAKSLGVENSLKAVVLPTILFIRFCKLKEIGFRWSWPLCGWIVLLSWSAISLIWSPFQFSGIKMVGYLYSYLATFAVLLQGWKRKQLTPAILALSLWLSLLLASIQTWLFNNPFGAPHSGEVYERFTSFSTPQGFAAFLIGVISVLLVSARVGWLAKIIHALGSALGLYLCGSRYTFVGAIAMLVIVALSFGMKGPNTRTQLYRFSGAVAVVIFIVTSIGIYFSNDPNSRIGEFVSVVERGESPFQSMGTLVWRRGIYDTALRRITERPLAELVFGSGTSSGATVVLGYDLRYTEDRVDANRVMHNELLRALYEWGIVGLLALLSIVCALAWVVFKMAVIRRVFPACSFLSLLPTVILGLLSENLLAGSSSPSGVGFLLSLTFGVCYAQIADQNRPETAIRVIESAVAYK